MLAFDTFDNSMQQTRGIHILKECRISINKIKLNPYTCINKQNYV